MTALTDVQVVHESETQRQHVRLSIPGRALLQGKKYEVRNLSAGGIALEGVAGSLAPGTIIHLDLMLPFNGFSLVMGVEAEVRHHDAREKLLGCRFINLGTQQVSFLAYVIKSFIGGEVVSAGGLLNVAARNNFTKPRVHANRNKTPGFGRQLPGLLLVALLGLLIVAFITENLYNSIFIVQAKDAVVAGPSLAVRAPAAGAVQYRLDPGLVVVKKGQVLGSVTPAGGSASSLVSPCDCYVTRKLAAEGALAIQGEKVIALAPVDAVPWIVAEVDPSAGMKIKPSSTASVSVFGSNAKYTGRVSSVESALVESGAESKAVRMKIVLDQKLPVDYINRLALVTFKTF